MRSWQSVVQVSGIDFSTEAHERLLSKTMDGLAAKSGKIVCSKQHDAIIRTQASESSRLIQLREVSLSKGKEICLRIFQSSAWPISWTNSSSWYRPRNKFGTLLPSKDNHTCHLYWMSHPRPVCLEIKSMSSIITVSRGVSRCCTMLTHPSFHKSLRDGKWFKCQKISPCPKKPSGYALMPHSLHSTRLKSSFLEAWMSFLEIK